MKPSLTVQEYTEGILQKDISVISRAITLAESSREDHQKTAAQIIEKILPHAGKSVRVGVTGVPGVGKSTFIEAYGQLLLEKGHSVAVLAVDPSSSMSKGSILGDKTRMEKLSAQKNVFIRPSPSGGSLGGVTMRTRESMLVCEAAGFDYILVETVGVGQSETEVHNITDFFLLLMLAGAGDELQGIKRGIMELADGIVITKADGSNVNKAKEARAEYARAIHLFPQTESGWIPEVKTCSAISHEGLPEVYDMIAKYIRHTQAAGYFDNKRKQQAMSWFEKLVEEKMRSRFFADPVIHAKYESAKQTVLSGGSVMSAVAAVFNS